MATVITTHPCASATRVRAFSPFTALPVDCAGKRLAIVVLTEEEAAYLDDLNPDQRATMNLAPTSTTE